MKRNKDNIVTAYQKGYRVVNGKPISFSGKEIFTRVHKGTHMFGIQTYDGKRVMIPIHRFIGYQKFGDEIFDDKKVVYHKDGVKSNNSEDNIVIGTNNDAQLSKAVDVRMKCAISATEKTIKYDHKLIVDAHYKDNLSRKEIMARFGMSSGTLHYILKQSREAKLD